MTRIAVQRALVSVYDKTGLDDLARGLHEAGVEIVSTGSTAACIRDLGVPVTPVEDVTGLPGDPRRPGQDAAPAHPRRVARRPGQSRACVHSGRSRHRAVSAARLQPVPVRRHDPRRRDAARGDRADRHRRPGDGARQREEPRLGRGNHRAGELSGGAGRRCAPAASTSRRGSCWPRPRSGTPPRTTSPSRVISATSSRPDDDGSGFPGWVGASWERAAVLRYGENPHQRAALYISHGGAAAVWAAQAEQLCGKEMSYNNYVDADAARRAAYDFGEPCVAIIKHANPCGIAIGADVAEAHRKAHACDPVSAYGGVIAANVRGQRRDGRAGGRDLHRGRRRPVLRRGRGRGAVQRARTCASSSRSRTVPPARLSSGRSRAGFSCRPPTASTRPATIPANWTLATGEPVDDATLAELAFAWRAVRAVRSNAILLARDGATVGVGMGQVNRVDSCRLAVTRAGDAGERCSSRLRRLFPFRGRAAGAARRRRARGRPAWRIGA